jgi:hypothetical protein
MRRCQGTRLAASNEIPINEEWIGRIVEGNGHGLNIGTMAGE